MFVYDIVNYKFIADIQKESRHMVVCRVAQEAITSHRDYIDRKTKNVIFTPM